MDENKPPQTWKEIENISKKLLASGQACGFTTGYQGWGQMENFAAIHNLPFSTHNNWFDHPPDCQCHGDVPVPTVLYDDSSRAD